MVEGGGPEGDVEALLERAALLNALRHDGKADLGSVVSMVLGESPRLRPMASEVAMMAKTTVKRINSMAAAAQVSLLRSRYPGAELAKEKEGRVGLPPLPNAVKGKASFRIPPEPSGYMHIGHAMAFTVNFLYKQMYDGELWLRFEDTNPKKVEKRYYESFRRGIKWLGIVWDHEKNVSEDLEEIYEYGTRLIEGGGAYACSCEEAKVKKLRFEGKACEHRSGPGAESLRLWKEMLQHRHSEGSLVIRLMGDVSSADYSLRDPNLFREIEKEHPVTGTRYAVWPTYDFANTVEDELCGITHVLRSSEFHTALQEFIRERLGFRKLEVIQFSRYNFKGTPVAKRLLRPLVEKGLVSGWDDPRMPTVDGMIRRGLLPEAIRRFTLQVGYTKSEHEYDWSLLFSVNRRLLDPMARRLFFVPDPVELQVAGAPSRRVTIPYHPERDLGHRTFVTDGSFFVPRSDIASMKKGAVFRLMDLYNVKLEGTGDRPKGTFTGEDLIADTKKLQWVTPAAVPVKVMQVGPLFKEDGEFDGGSLAIVEGLAEPSIDEQKAGEVFQFPRFGFCRLDSPRVLVLGHK